MKKLFIGFSLLLALAFTTNSVKAQTVPTVGDVQLALGNLVALQVGDINVNIDDVIDIGDITIQDITVTAVVVVTDVLNDNNIDISILRTVTVDNVLNDLLRDANIITDNQIVVGVLNGVIFVADKKTRKK